MLSSFYSHTDPTIKDALVINDNSPPILENDILMEEDDIFADPSTSKFEKSKTDCSDENHYAGMEVLEQIKEKFQKSASNDENSRMMPGMKDFVSVKKDDGSRQHVKKS